MITRRNAIGSFALFAELVASGQLAAAGPQTSPASSPAVPRPPVFKQDLPNALQRLNRGLGIAGNNADLAMAAALVHEAQGDQKQMIPFLVVTARMTADTAQREWAVKRVNDILAMQASGSAAK